MVVYEKEKREVIEWSVWSGGLEIVEMLDGEFIVVDKDGFFLLMIDGSLVIVQVGQKFDCEVVD